MVSKSCAMLYAKLQPGQQEAFGHIIVDKLRDLIGGYGELQMLAEFIAQMLRSRRPPERIQRELQEFLPEHSELFTTWLFYRLVSLVGSGSAPPVTPSLLTLGACGGGGQRMVQKTEREEADCRWPLAAASEEALRRTGRSRSPKLAGAYIQQQQGAAERTQREDCQDGAYVAESLARERKDGAYVAESLATHAVHASPLLQAVPTPARNVRHLRDQFQGKIDATGVRSVGSMGSTRSDVRSEGPLLPNRREGGEPRLQLPHRALFPAPALGTVASLPAVALLPAAPFPPPRPSSSSSCSLQVQSSCSMPPSLLEQDAFPPLPPTCSPGSPPKLALSCDASVGPALIAAAQASLQERRPQQRSPPKQLAGRCTRCRTWQVVRANTIVRKTKHLNSDQVAALQIGDVVEKVADFVLKGGVVRFQITRPPGLPPDVAHDDTPYGWVTQDATAAGGPLFLEEVCSGDCTHLRA